MIEPSLKKKVLDAVDQLPANATVEDVMERLYLLAKIERGETDADAGRLTSHEQVQARFAL